MLHVALDNQPSTSRDVAPVIVGEALDRSLKCGNEAFDRNLNLVRLDLFGNVMILNAPHWSDVSAQFTHGFPRRLITDTHRGILPGNITVAARISNQGIRSVSPGDVAAFMSKEMIRGLGLTVTELMLAQMTAIRYAGKKDKPGGNDGFALESTS